MTYIKCIVLSEDFLYTRKIISYKHVENLTNGELHYVRS